jgi:lipopolysaccharide/colanic/teichoic acid biosynthesis glycosyltransferase
MLDPNVVSAVRGDPGWVTSVIWEPSYAQIKRIIDIAVTTAALIVLSPLILLLGLVVKLTSRGPMLFRQERVGQDGKIFEILKLRTMCHDAEDGTGPVWARRNDPRITPIGYFLRRSHLDEIPQLVNVLLGDMSLVGPRPERPFFVEQFRKELPQYDQRVRTKPGITGLAQIYHKYDETMEDVHQKLVYDISYAHRTSFSLDVAIIFGTLRKLTGDRQAN